MAQATAAGLPGKLDGAARFAGVPVKKRASGKDLIKLFTTARLHRHARESHPEEWAEFLRYAADDIGAMRGVFRFTLQLPIEEWQEYWVSRADQPERHRLRPEARRSAPRSWPQRTK